MMVLFITLILHLGLLPLRTLCQTVQDDWTAPAAPDGSTPLQTGTKFTLLWKRNLEHSFEIYCPLCNTTRLDLWVTNFNGTKYQSKIGRGLDLTTSTSYDWNVQIASSEFSENDFWVFRFTFFDSVDPYTQQISSPGFRISGLVKAVSTSTVQAISSTSATATMITPSSVTTTSIGTTSSSSSIPQDTEQIPDTNSSPESKVWISGVVIGPIVGLGLGAALMWFCLRKRKKQRAQQEQADNMHGQSNWNQRYLPNQVPVEKYSHTSKMDSQPWQQQAGSQGQCVAEAPGNITPPPPAELWHGNYRS